MKNCGWRHQRSARMWSSRNAPAAASGSGNGTARGERPGDSQSPHTHHTRPSDSTPIHPKECKHGSAKTLCKNAHGSFSPNRHGLGSIRTSINRQTVTPIQWTLLPIKGTSHQGTQQCVYISESLC